MTISDGGPGHRPPRGRPGATLAAVAAAVGVSRTTVSNAYNRPDQLSAELHARIMAAAADLGYSGPDPVARSLRTRQADAVGLIFSERLGYAFRDPGAVEFLHGLAEACTERGKSLLMIPAMPDATNANTVLRASVDGFVVSSLQTGDSHLDAALLRTQPVVVVDSPVDLAGVDFVGIDDRAAFSEVAEHVVSLGHRRIGVVAVHAEREPAPRQPGPLSERLSRYSSPHPVRQLRLQGLADVADRVGAQVLVSERPSNTREEGSLGVRELLAADGGLTAVMCTSDILAFGVQDELGATALTVTGFDDVGAAAAAGLTTMRQPMERKGRGAIGALLDDRPRPRAIRLTLPTTLVVRESSRPVY